MAHRNARLTQFGRLLLVQRITELGWPPARRPRAWGVAGHGLQVAGPLPHRRPGRPGRPELATPSLSACLVGQPGPSGAGGPPSAPPGPHRLGYHLGMAHSTVYGVLRRHGMSRLAHTDRASGVVVRYQRERPGELVHIDVKKLGRIPDGGGHRVHGRAKAARAGASATTMCIRPSMTAPGSPSASSWTTRPPRPALASWSRRPASSPTKGSGSSGC